MINLEFHDVESFSGSNVDWKMDVELEIHNDEFELTVKASGSYANGKITLKDLYEQMVADIENYISEL